MAVETCPTATHVPAGHTCPALLAWPHECSSPKCKRASPEHLGDGESNTVPYSFLLFLHPDFAVGIGRRPSPVVFSNSPNPSPIIPAKGCLVNSSKVPGK